MLKSVSLSCSVFVVQLVGSCHQRCMIRRATLYMCVVELDRSPENARICPVMPGHCTTNWLLVCRRRLGLGVQRGAATADTAG